MARTSCQWQHPRHSFCPSHFLISRHCCRLSVSSAAESAQSPTIRPRKSVGGSTAVTRSPFYTPADWRNRAVQETHPHAVWVCAVNECFTEISWHDADWGETNTRTDQKVNVFLHSPGGPYLGLPCLTACFLIPPLSHWPEHHSVAGHRQRHLLLVITPMSPCCHPPPHIYWISSYLLFNQTLFISDQFSFKCIEMDAGPYFGGGPVEWWV